MPCCSKDARSKDATASDKLKAARAGDQDAKRLEEEAAKLAERSRAAQEKAERTEKEAHSVRTGLSSIQGDAKSRRQAAERSVHLLFHTLFFGGETLACSALLPCYQVSKHVSPFVFTVVCFSIFCNLRNSFCNWLQAHSCKYLLSNFCTCI